MEIGFTPCSAVVKVVMVGRGHPIWLGACFVSADCESVCIVSPGTLPHVSNLDRKSKGNSVSGPDFGRLAWFLGRGRLEG